MKTLLLKIVLAIACMSMMVSCETVKCDLKPGDVPDNLVTGTWEDYYSDDVNNGDKKNISAIEMQDNYLKNMKGLTLIFEENPKENPKEELKKHLKEIRGQEQAILPNRQVGLINNDNLDVVFTLDNLQDYFCYIKNEFEKLTKRLSRGEIVDEEIIEYLSYSDHELGVRIYFAAKPDKRDNNLMKTTVFLVPVVRTNPEDSIPEYLDIRHIPPLNFGNARKPPHLYKGYEPILDIQRN